MDAQLELLERAAAVLNSGAVGVVAERSAAESTFLAFRQSKQPFEFCRYALQQSHNPYVQFMTASTICEALIREWSTLSHEQVDSLQTFLLTVIAQNPSLDTYVREKLLVACVIILKRCLLDKDICKHSWQSLLSKVQALLSGSCAEITVGCAVLRALVRECSLSASGDAGLAWSSHCCCKAIFQSQCLPQAFQLVCEVLRQYSRLDSLEGIQRDQLGVLAGFLEVAEFCLNWDFTTSRFQTPSLTVTSFRPGRDWTAVVVKSDIRTVMFKLYTLCKGVDKLNILSLRCLCQMGSLSGPALTDFHDEVSYVKAYLELFMPVLHTILEQYCHKDDVCMACANIVFFLINAHGINLWNKIDDQLCQTFACLISTLACRAAQSARAMEDAGDVDSAQLFQEAFDKVLESWITWLTTYGNRAHEVMLQQSVAIFEAYLSWRLTGTSPSFQDSEEVDELDEDDRIRFEDQLCAMGSLSRAILPACLPVLCRLIEERLQRFQELYQQCSVQSAVNTEAAQQSLSGLYEDLHWLVLLSGHTLCYDCLSGEVPIVPKPIRDFTNAQHNQGTVDATRALMMSLGQSSSAVACPDGADAVVRLMVDVMHLADFQHAVHARSAGGQSAIAPSPQLSRSLFWYLRCWCATYVMFNADANAVSPSLSNSLSLQGEGKMCLQWLVDHMTSELPLWAADFDVLKDIVDMLSSLAECPIRFHLALETEAFWKLTVSCVRSDSWLRLAVSGTRTALLSALVTGCSNPPSAWSTGSGRPHYAKMFTQEQLAQIEERLSTFLRLVLSPLTERFVNLQIGSPSFSGSWQTAGVVGELCMLLDLLSGVFRGVKGATLSTIFELFCGLCLPGKPNGQVSGDEVRAIASGACFDNESNSMLALVNIYADRSDVLVYILQFFEAVSKSLLPLVSSNEAPAVFAVLLRVMQIYSKVTVGKLSRLSSAKEEEQLEDLLIFMKLFDNLISRDYWVEAEAEDNGTGPVEGVDVCLCGLNLILPLITSDLLQFPKMCEEFFRIVTFVCEFHSGKIAGLPDTLFKAVVQALELGLSLYGSEVMRMALDSLASMAEWLFMKGDRHVEEATRLKPVMQHFLEVVFNKVLVNQADGLSEIHSAAEALFTLLCCNQAAYQQLAMKLVSAQVNVSDKQRLMTAFAELTPDDLELSPQHANKMVFRRKLQGLLETVRDLLVS